MRVVISVNADYSNGAQRVLDTIDDHSGKVVSNNSERDEFQQITARVNADCIDALEGMVEVRYVERDQEWTAFEDPEEYFELDEVVDTYSEEEMWWLSQMNGDQLHEEGATGSDTGIGIVDTGISH